MTVEPQDAFCNFDQLEGLNLKLLCEKGNINQDLGTGNHYGQMQKENLA